MRPRFCANIAEILLQYHTLKILLWQFTRSHCNRVNNFSCFWFFKKMFYYEKWTHLHLYLIWILFDRREVKLSTFMFCLLINKFLNPRASHFSNCNCFYKHSCHNMAHIQYYVETMHTVKQILTKCNLFLIICGCLLYTSRCV